MLPIHTILHPTDFSDRSRHALHLACALARDHGARLVVLHVEPIHYLGLSEGAIPPDPGVILAQAKEQLERLEIPDPNLRSERHFAEGDPAKEILRAAREVASDLIIMGTHGRTGLSRLLMGSVAEQVVRRAPCPVLTVKDPVPAAELAVEPAALASALA
jgi:nucleotide-binding universal stress UspA family protein